MADSNEVQALKNIITEIDNSQIKILNSTQNLKAKKYLFDTLRKQFEKQKEQCMFVGNSNLKLAAEIKLVEQQIESFNIATEIIKLSNIELNKEYLLSKESKAEIFERIENGKKKYDDLWSVCKKRYETIPAVQILIQAKTNNDRIEANINHLINESRHLRNQIKLKKQELEDKDRAIIIEFAEFFIYQRPKIILKINENSLNIKELENKIGAFMKAGYGNNRTVLYDRQVQEDETQPVATVKDLMLDDNSPHFCKTVDTDVLLSFKNLPDNGLDTLIVKLDQLKKVDLQNTTPVKRAGYIVSTGLEDNSHKISEVDNKMKENHISPYFDISLDNNKIFETKNNSKNKLIHILEDVKLDTNDTLKIINNLEPAKFKEAAFIHSYENIVDTQNKKDESMEIEEIDKINTTKLDAVVDPPTQFLDVTQQQEDMVIANFNESKVNVDENHDLNEDDYNKTMEHEPNIISADITTNKSQRQNEISAADYNIVAMSRPKSQIRNLEVPVSEFLFNGPQGIADSFDASISTTGFEDNEDFHHCIDTSLLLSPNADESSNNNEVTSQEPNFLTGMRKIGQSFFGGSTSSKNKPDSGGQSGSFSFTFGNEEKNGRGGLFNMFH